MGLGKLPRGVISLDNAMIRVALFAALTLTTTSVSAQDFSESEKLYTKSCRNCHGPTAKGMGSFPKLIGHSADHLADRLKQYRAGETVGPNSPLMKPVVAKLSDEEIKNLSEYIATTFR